MSDTKERDETAPENLPVATPGENQPAPEAVVAVPGTGKPNGGGEGGAAVEGSDPSVVVKGDGVAVGSESGGSVPMDTTESKVDFDGAAEGEKIGSQAETKVSPADVAGDDKIGAEAAGMVDPDEAVEGKKVDTKPETKVSPAEGGEDNKIGAEVETKIRSVEAAGDEKSGNGSADNGQAKSQPKESSGTKSVAVNSIPDKTVGKDVAATAEIVTPVKAVEPASDTVVPGSEMPVQTAETTDDVKTDVLPVSEIKADVDQEMVPADRNEEAVVDAGTAVVKAASGELGNDIKDQVTATGAKLETNEHGMIMSTPVNNGKSLAKDSFLLDDDDDGNDWGTEEEQVAFMKELENFFRSRSMEFKPPKFYGEGLNLLKLWRSVMRLGGYDKVTACKLWRQVGESFRPPKTCTTVSWTFRGFYEKALLDYERHKVNGGEVTLPIASQSEPGIEQSGSGRARRDAAARAMQGWHSQRLLGNGEVSDPVIKDKTPLSLQKREKQLKNTGLLKRKKPSYVDSAVKVPRTQASKTQLDVAVVDLGPPADWVKINVQRTKDCFEIYALVPGLLREEVRVQSDPAGRLVISGEPEHPENPWGVTPFKKVISLSSRIDPHQTSAVVTLHGQLFVRVPFEQSE